MDFSDFKDFKKAIFVFAGGFIGGVLRYLLTSVIPADSYNIFPLLLVNFIGVFLISITKLKSDFYITGLLGGFTSFGTLIIVSLVQSNYLFGGINILVSVLGSYLIIWLVKSRQI